MNRIVGNNIRLRIKQRRTAQNQLQKSKKQMTTIIYSLTWQVSKWLMIFICHLRAKVTTSRAGGRSFNVSMDQLMSNLTNMDRHFWMNFNQKEKRPVISSKKSSINTREASGCVCAPQSPKRCDFKKESNCAFTWKWWSVSIAWCFFWRSFFTIFFLRWSSQRFSIFGWVITATWHSKNVR